MSKTVIIGTAHGVNTPGKHSPDKRLREYKYSREICKMVQSALTAKGVKAIIDIEGETESSLNGRVSLVNSLVAKHGGASNCVYVSIHNNAAGANGKWHSARGFCVFVAPNASSNSKRLATLFHKNALKAGLAGNRSYPSTGYYVKSLAVCRDTTCPAVLTENLFQDNVDDVNFLLSEEGKKTIADLHVKSICDYLGM